MQKINDLCSDMKPYVNFKGFMQIIYFLCRGTQGYEVNIGIMWVDDVTYGVLEAYVDTKILM